jgi:predicted RNase H-like HicB family nuclease
LTSQRLSAKVTGGGKTTIAASTLMREYQFPVVIEYDPEEDVYLADCPLLQGCYTDGKSYEEALENIKDALRLCIASRLAVGDPIPTP